MAEFEIESAGVTLAGEEAGEGPAVVGLHGLTATRRYVVMGSRALERGGHRLVLLDARGHGASSPAPSYGYADMAGDLLVLLDELGIDEAVLAGASMGAHAAIRFALDHPERTAGLVIATPAFEPGAEADASKLARWDALAEGLRSGGVEGFVEAYGPPDVPEAWRETVGRVLRQRLAAHEHPDAVADALQAVPRSAPFEAWEELAALEMPAIVVASRDDADPGHPYATGARYAQALPNARLVSEEPGASPLAWQGGQLSKVIAGVAAEAYPSRK